MPRAGFGAASDYSGFFASLHLADESNRERLALEQERRTDERQAAADAEMFSKYQHGDVSGAELLDYIRQRIGETTHDPEENAKWKDALRDYEQSISDQNAEDVFANGGSIHDLIAYYSERKNSLDTGTPVYSEVSRRLNDLIDQAAADDLYLGAERIRDKIAKGKATWGDLAKFYRQQLRGLRPGSSILDEVRRQLDAVEDQIQQQNVERQIAEIDYKYQNNQLTGAQANRQLRAVAAIFQNADPARYYSLLTQGQAYLDRDRSERITVESTRVDLLFQQGQIDAAEANRRLTVLANSVRASDPQAYAQLLEAGQAYLSAAQTERLTVESTRVDLLFQQGKIDAAEANRRLIALANSVRQTDPQAYIELLRAGQSYLSAAQAEVDADAIPNPDALAGYAPGGVAPGAAPGGVAPNLDIGGAPRAGVYVHPVTGRAWENRPVEHGASVTPTGPGITINDFLRALGEHESGNNYEAVNSTTGARGKYQHLPEYWPSRAARWLGNANAPMTPENQETVTRAMVQQLYDRWGDWRLVALAWHNGSVNDTNPNDWSLRNQKYVNRVMRRLGADMWTPVTTEGVYMPEGISAPSGPLGDDEQPETTRRETDTTPRSRTDREGRPRPYRFDPPETSNDVREQLETLGVLQQRAIDMYTAFNRGDKKFPERDGSFTPLTYERVLAEAEQAMSSVDYGVQLFYAIEDDSGAEEMKNFRVTLSGQLLSLGDQRQEFLFNQVLQDVASSLDWSDAHDADPNQAWGRVQAALDRLNRFGANLDPGLGSEAAPEGVTDQFRTSVQSVIDSINIAANPEASPADRANAIGSFAGDDFLGTIITQVAGVADVYQGVQTGAYVPVVVPRYDEDNNPVRDQNGNPVTTFSVAPTTEVVRPDGRTERVPVDSSLVPIIVDGVLRWAEPVQVDAGWNQLFVHKPDALAALLPKGVTRDAVAALPADSPIPTAYLSSLNAEAIRNLLNNATLTMMPFTVTAVRIPSFQPGSTTTRREGPPAQADEQVWYLDPETGWQQDRPAAPRPDGFGLGTVYQSSPTDQNPFGVPELNYRPSSQSVPVPYSGDPRKAQALLNSGVLAPYLPITWTGRDQNGDVVPIQPNLATLFDKSPLNLYQNTPDFRQRAQSVVPLPGAQPSAVQPAAQRSVAPALDPVATWDELMGTARLLGINVPQLPIFNTLATQMYRATPDQREKFTVPAPVRPAPRPVPTPRITLPRYEPVATGVPVYRPAAPVPTRTQTPRVSPSVGFTIPSPASSTPAAFTPNVLDWSQTRTRVG